MEWINYHHLLYFWVTAREGSITRASERLNLAQPTVSGQIQSLEKAIGEQLFLRQGRKLTMTETGRVVFGYAKAADGYRAAWAEAQRMFTAEQLTELGFPTPPPAPRGCSRR